MATQRDIDRGLAQRRYGKSCYCCGKGPLSGHGLFLAPIGYTEYANTAPPLAPVCASCRTALKTIPTLRHIENLRRDLRKCLVTTRRWADEIHGLDFAYLSEN
jgi:hypothetical protein